MEKHDDDSQSKDEVVSRQDTAPLADAENHETSGHGEDQDATSEAFGWAYEDANGRDDEEDGHEEQYDREQINSQDDIKAAELVDASSDTKVPSKVNAQQTTRDPEQSPTIAKKQVGITSNDLPDGRPEEILTIPRELLEFENIVRDQSRAHDDNMAVPTANTPQTTSLIRGVAHVMLDIKRILDTRSTLGPRGRSALWKALRLLDCIRLQFCLASDHALNGWPPLSCEERVFIDDLDALHCPDEYESGLGVWSEDELPIVDALLEARAMRIRFFNYFTYYTSPNMAFLETLCALFTAWPGHVKANQELFEACRPDTPRGAWIASYRIPNEPHTTWDTPVLKSLVYAWYLLEDLRVKLDRPGICFLYFFRHTVSTIDKVLHGSNAFEIARTQEEYLQDYRQSLIVRTLKNAYQEAEKVMSRPDPPSRSWVSSISHPYSAICNLLHDRLTNAITRAVAVVDYDDECGDEPAEQELEWE